MCRGLQSSGTGVNNLIREINASILVDMFISGANNLLNNRQKVDEMNVFPVPDGDTGTNMSMTMKSCVAGLHANADSTVSAVAKSVANDTLRGARGNSGVILSQLMRGFNKAFTGAVTCDVQLLAKAFKSASDSAYRAVMKPTEGTILTVAREMAECAVKYAPEFEDFAEFFALITDAGNKALAKTPELLPKLKQAGVVDSGGQGLMYIIEGMYYYITKNEIIELNDKETESQETVVHTSEEEIKFGYCTECIIDKKEKGKSAFKFKANVENLGDSMVFVDDDDIVKIHIHTNEPDVVLREALKIGALATVKIENMRLQHSEVIKSSAEKKTLPEKKDKYAFVSVAVGDGIVSLLKELGVSEVIEGGQTMNPSTDDILKAFELINAETIYVFPNNKNVLMSAQQAAKLSDANVIVIPTTSVTQCMSCMLVFDSDIGADENKALFEEVLLTVKSAQITYAVRDTQIEDVVIKEGDYLSIVDGKIKSSEKSAESAVMASLDVMKDDETSTISIFYGEDVTEDEAESLCEKIESKYDDCDVIMNCGAQPVYHYLISVE